MNGPRLLPLAALLLLAPPALAQDPPAPPAPAPREEPAKEDLAKADLADLEALVRKAMPLVEKLRGGKFTSTPPVQAVTRDQFIDRYNKDLARVLGGEERVAATSRLLSRLGVIEAGADLRALLASFLKGSIAANYDPETKKVSFLPGIPRTLQLMIHELTHALDDQLFDMSAQIKSWDGSFDRALAYGALAEGDAQSIEMRFATGGAIVGQPLDQLRIQAEAVGDSILKQQFGGTPPALVLAFKSQYTEGLVFAEAVRRTEKRNGAMDAAFKAPPASTEQVLHPEKFLAGEDPPVGLVLPASTAAGAKTLVTTTMGELGIRIVLISRGMAAKDAAAAAAGWGGDTAALVSFPAGEALLWTTTWDTEADATAFYEAMKVAFPTQTGIGSDRATRGLVQRGPVVEFVEAPLDALPAAVAMVRKVERK